MHFNWYWHQVSLDRADIEFRLIHLDSVDEAVGMIGYGQAYADEHLLEPIAGTYELAHLVIDPRHHHRGIGRVAARAVLTALASNPDAESIIVAHHPDNEPSRKLFTSLGLQPTDQRNYDGDPLLAASPWNLLIEAGTSSAD